MIYQAGTVLVLEILKLHVKRNVGQLNISMPIFFMCFTHDGTFENNLLGVNISYTDTYRFIRFNRFAPYTCVFHCFSWKVIASFFRYNFILSIFSIRQHTKAEHTSLSIMSEFVHQWSDVAKCSGFRCIYRAMYTHLNRSLIFPTKHFLKNYDQPRTLESIYQTKQSPKRRIT